MLLTLDVHITIRNLLLINLVINPTNKSKILQQLNHRNSASVAFIPIGPSTRVTYLHKAYIRVYSLYLYICVRIYIPTYTRSSVRQYEIILLLRPRILADTI